MNSTPLSRTPHPSRRRGRERLLLRGHRRVRPIHSLRRLGRAVAVVGRLPAGAVRLHDLNRRDLAAAVDGAGAAELSHRASRAGHDSRRG